MDKKVVLIVEDNKDLLESYSDIVQLAGYETIKASDGYKGLEALAANKNKISLVILDMMMPGMDGLEFLTNIHDDSGKYGKPPVIVLSAMTSELVIKEAYKLGVVSYLKKTEIEVPQFIKEIDRVLKK